MNDLEQLALQQNKDIFNSLFYIDEKIANLYRLWNKCKICNSKLHVANYDRKPKGTLSENRDFTKRFSFCCSNKKNGCRKRINPPSFRYFLRFHYLSIFFIVIGAVIVAKKESINFISKKYKVPKWTLLRWRIFWTEKFIYSKRYFFIKSMYTFAVTIPTYFVFDININYLKILDIFKADDIVNLGGYKLPHNLPPIQNTE